MVDVNEFCRLLRVERSPFVERLFSMFDTDRGGLIDLKEFIVGVCAQCRCSRCGRRCAHSRHAGLANVSGDVREDKVRFAFEIFDLDNSGFIEVHELRKIVRATNLASEKQLDRKVRWLLSQCDIDGDGQIRCARQRAQRAQQAARTASRRRHAVTRRAASQSSKASPRDIRTFCSLLSAWLAPSEMPACAMPVSRWAPRLGFRPWQHIPPATSRRLPLYRGRVLGFALSQLHAPKVMLVLACR